MDNEQKEYSVTLSGKQAGFALAAIVAFLSSVPLAIKFNPDTRADPYTGKQGRAVENRLDILELTIEHIIEVDEECKRRLDAHLEMSEQKVNEITRDFATIKEQQRAQDQLIAQCLRRLYN